MNLEKVPEGLECLRRLTFTGKSMVTQSQHQSLIQESKLRPQLLLSSSLTPLHTNQDNSPKGGAWMCVTEQDLRSAQP